MFPESQGRASLSASYCFCSAGSLLMLARMALPASTGSLHLVSRYAELLGGLQRHEKMAYH